MKNYKLHMSYKYLKYTEGDNSIELDIESLTNGSSVIYVPNNDKWNKQFGEWAIDRKEEILENIKGELKENYENKKYIFTEY